MTTATILESEILDRLRVNLAERKRLADEEAGLWDLLAKVQSGAGAPVPLAFDDDKRTIRWDGGSVCLGKKPYRFVKALYFAKKRRLKRAQVDYIVWKKQIVGGRTVYETFRQLRNTLREAQFPYEIVRRMQSGQIKTVENPITKKTKEVLIDTEFEKYGLRAKKTF